jgi:hypothetical protein
LKISASKVVLGLISLGIGGFLLLGSWEAYSNYTHAQEYSGRATGCITKKHFLRASDGNTSYYVDYWFVPPAGGKKETTGTIPKQLWDTIKVDDKIEIKYDPVNPGRSFPMNDGSASLIFTFFIFVMGAVFSVFGISNFLASLKRR